MLLYRLRRKIIRYLRFQKVLLRSLFIPVKEKSIYIDITGIAINRYLYAFLKMFQLEGYSIFIPKNIDMVNILAKSEGEFRYASWLLKEKVVKFGKPKITDLLEISKNNLSNDYFKDNTEGYRVPMCFYPWFYKNYELIRKLKLKEERKKSMFMSGNIDANYYDRLSNSQVFKNIPSRKKVADYLRNTNYYYPIKNSKKLSVFLENQTDNKIIIIDSSIDFRIGLKDLPSILNQFAFYLALPGIVIPQSHNLTEAMFCGCILVIHKEYAELLDPPLTSFHNAIIYNSLEELATLTPDIFKLKDFEIRQMRENVIAYYNTYLSSEAVVKHVLQNPAKIFIQAEHISLK